MTIWLYLDQLTSFFVKTLRKVVRIQWMFWNFLREILKWTSVLYEVQNWSKTFTNLEIVEVTFVLFFLFFLWSLMNLFNDKISLKVFLFVNIISLLFFFSRLVGWCGIGLSRHLLLALPLSSMMAHQWCQISTFYGIWLTE